MVTTLGLEQEQQIHEIYETRAVLEGLAGRLFAERASDAQIARLGRVVHQLKEACEAKNWDAMFKAKTRFYEVLEQGCRNAIACAQMRILRTRTTLLRGIILSRESRARQSINEIHDILDAVERRDAEAAWTACVRHMERGADFALEILEEERKRGTTEDTPPAEPNPKKRGTAAKTL